MRDYNLEKYYFWPTLSAKDGSNQVSIMQLKMVAICVAISHNGTQNSKLVYCAAVCFRVICV
jgi:hypothetical protein